MKDAKTGRFRRIWQTLKAWEQAMDYAPGDYALDRVDTLQREVTALRDEVSWLRAEHGGGSAHSKIFHS